jgi:predicted RNA-binding protein with RPS1 domain
MRSSFQLLVLACQLCLSAALLPCQTRIVASRVAAPRAAWAVRMCDAGDAAPEAAASEPAEEPAAAVAAAPARKSRGQKLPLDGLVVGSMVEGTVRSVQSYGAFVDIGFASDGLLHVSEMSDAFVKDANDMFAVGDTVNVRVKSVDLEKNQVALSNKDPSAAKPQGAPRGGGGAGGGGGRRDRDSADVSEFKEADEKKFITGTVRSIQSFGAFVNLKDGVDGLLHISEIQEGGVKSVGDVLKEGQEVQVRVVSFDDKRRIGLSMKPFVELTEEEKADKAAGRRPRRQRGGGGGSPDDDAAFKMEPAELEKLTLDYEEEPASSFAAALARSEEIKAVKAAKKKFKSLVL